MHRLLATIALFALAIVAAPAAQAAPLSLDGVAKAFPDSQVSYAKNKGWKGKTMRGRGPPPWARARGYHRKRGR